MVQAQPRQEVHKTPPQPMVRHGGTCLSSQLCGEAQTELQSMSASTYTETLSQK
jgi:hypothetical protein